jgi:hypothetical protein
MSLRAGDYVAVRSAEEIEATLDANGCLENLPFMPEMAPYCGTVHRVFKRIDKIIDIVENTGLRRMRNTVTLEDLRCDGSAHRGCQSGCQMLWKEAWLRRCTAREVRARDLVPSRTPTAALLSRLKTLTQYAPAERHCCQATELFKASQTLHRWDLRQFLEPLWFGNVTFVEFLRGISIPLFNAVQHVHKGCEYPYWVGSRLTKTPTSSLGLQRGEWVRVRTKDEILLTLDRRNRNRGLWFDREMLRFCGRRFRVLRRVERLIEEKSGRLIELDNPSVILEGVTARGESYRFNPQNDYLLWREIWLERLHESSTSVAARDGQPLRPEVQ